MSDMHIFRDNHITVHVPPILMHIHTSTHMSASITLWFGSVTTNAGVVRHDHITANHTTTLQNKHQSNLSNCNNNSKCNDNINGCNNKQYVHMRFVFASKSNKRSTHSENAIVTP